MLTGSALRRVLSALKDGRDRLAIDICVDACCTHAELFQVAEAGFLRFQPNGAGNRACITPKGTEKFNACKRAEP